MARGVVCTQGVETLPCWHVHPQPGYRISMSNPEEPRRPTANHPLNAPKRSWKLPALMVLLLIVVVVAVFVLLTVLRYNAP